VVRAHKQKEDIVAQAPDGFGSVPATYRYDVIFLKEPLSAKTLEDKYVLRLITQNMTADHLH
jgi:hypothetical protein